jgi:hypothetical protein
VSALATALLAASAAIDGAAAHRHASALAALGPHPWGTPRARAAAQYVAAQMRAAGLRDVRLEPFAAHGRRGANVIGVRPGSGPGFVVVGAHHDTAPESPGAYDDGGGVGVLLEVARAQAAAARPVRTLVFASWDGEEAWSTGLTTTAGSREHVRALGPRGREMVAALAIEMCGWAGGAPVLHPIAYSDPLRPGRYVAAPAWVMRAALQGAREAGSPFAVGDPLLSWLYQPTVRTFRARLYGDDLSFLQAGLPAVFASDSSFTAFYPWYHRPADTPDKLDPRALARMGGAVLGALRALEHAQPAGAERDWFALGSVVIGRTGLAAVVVSSLALLMARGRSWAGGRVYLLAHAALVAVLWWRNPVPVLWVFVLPQLGVAARGRRPRLVPGVLLLLPLLALITLGALAWARGFVSGLWLASWELALAAAALVLLWLSAPAR